MTDLTTIFGSDICVSVLPRQPELQLSGFAGANGLVGVNLGTRGRQIIISGTLWGNGSTYAAARQNAQAWIDDIEALCSVPEADYSFNYDRFYYCILEKIQPIVDTDGKMYHWHNGYVTAKFVAVMREMI